MGKEQTFKVKDEVVYPLHGVGIIESTEERLIDNKTLKFFKVKLRDSGMFISVPIHKAPELGLRKVIDKKEVREVIKQLAVFPKKIEDNWKLRFQENIDKLKTGDIKNITDVVKELFLRNKVKSLSVMERKQYENAYRMLVKEIAISEKAAEEEVQNLISGTLDQLAQKFEKKQRKTSDD